MKYVQHIPARNPFVKGEGNSVIEREPFPLIDGFFFKWAPKKCNPLYLLASTDAWGDRAMHVVT